MFDVPLLATNWIAVHKIPFLPNDLVLLKRFKYRSRDALLPFEELLKLDYGEYLYYNLHRKNVQVIDNTPEELINATCEMLERLHMKSGGTEAKYLPLPSRFRGHPVVSEAQFARASYFY
jgi:putative glycosyltransferase (TIGR04372 family)